MLRLLTRFLGTVAQRSGCWSSRHARLSHEKVSAQHRTRDSRNLMPNYPTLPWQLFPVYPTIHPCQYVNKSNFYANDVRAIAINRAFTPRTLCSLVNKSRYIQGTDKLTTIMFGYRRNVTVSINDWLLNLHDHFICKRSRDYRKWMMYKMIFDGKSTRQLVDFHENDVLKALL